MRRPKGSYTRHTTDWFIGRCAIAGVFFIPTNTNAGLVELYNNATDGSNLHVYRIWVWTAASGGYVVTRQTGTMGGTQVQTYPVVSQGAALWGLVNYGTTAGISYPPATPFALPGMVAGDNYAGSQDTFGADGPICVLQPGDSLRAYTPWASAISNGEIACTYYWAVMNDLG